MDTRITFLIDPKRGLQICNEAANHMKYVATLLVDWLWSLRNKVMHGWDKILVESFVKEINMATQVITNAEKVRKLHIEHGKLIFT